MSKRAVTGCNPRLEDAAHDKPLTCVTCRFWPPLAKHWLLLSLPDGINRMSQRLMRAAEYLVKGGLLSGEKEGKEIYGLTESKHD